MDDATTPGDFTPQAAAYRRARPGYPEAMVDRLLARVSVGEGDRVVEIGAGTGLFTERLAARGLGVDALEPNAAMRTAAPRLDGVAWTDGTFEKSGCPDGYTPWCVAAQAFHWAEPSLALPELSRICRRGGHLTVLWNNRDVERSPLLGFTRARVQAMVPGFDEGYRARDWAAVLACDGHFGEVAIDEVRHEVPMSLARFCDLWRSHNLLNAAARPGEIDGLVGAITAWWEANVETEVVGVPYLCRAFTAKRSRA